MFSYKSFWNLRNIAAEYQLFENNSQKIYYLQNSDINLVERGVKQDPKIK